jgi:hypothetical protein
VGSSSRLRKFKKTKLAELAEKTPQVGLQTTPFGGDPRNCGNTPQVPASLTRRVLLPQITPGGGFAVCSRPLLRLYSGSAERQHMKSCERLLLVTSLVALAAATAVILAALWPG